jgi:hypothetical protein
MGFQMSQCCSDASSSTYFMIYVLIDKLNSYGMKDETNFWFKSYLSHSIQFVEITEIDCSNSFKNSYTSSCMKVEQDLPQKSILGPIYLCYIYNFAENVQGFYSQMIPIC